MAEKSSYQVQVDAKMLQIVESLIDELPDFVSDYIHSKILITSTRTLQQYCYSIRRFFNWLRDNVAAFKGTPIRDISVKALSKIKARDLEKFMLHLQNDSTSPNSRASVAQKMAAIASLFSYLYRHDMIDMNPCAKIDRPKLVKDNRIIYLTDNEAIKLLNVIEYGDPSIPEHQAFYLEKTRCRDLAIATLMLDTGVRLSECIGLNIDDVDFSQRRIQVYRKGGKYQYLPINDEVLEILASYVAERKRVVVLGKDNENALFLSMQNRRISADSTIEIIKKYANFAGITKKITPHKLRKTYGTALYRKTRDIYLTANALGHENVATTSKHYVDDNAESLREVANQVRIRPENATE